MGLQRKWDETDDNGNFISEAWKGKSRIRWLREEQVSQF